VAKSDFDFSRQVEGGMSSSGTDVEVPIFWKTCGMPGDPPVKRKSTFYLSLKSFDKETDR